MADAAMPRRGTPVADGLAFALACFASFAAWVVGTDRPVVALHSILYDRGPYAVVLGVLAGFSLIVGLAWLVRGRARAWPPFAVGFGVASVAWLVGAYRLQMGWAKATPDLTLAGRTSRMNAAIGEGTDVWVAAGIVIAGLLVVASLGFALRARARAPVSVTSIRRVLALVIGAVAICAVLAILIQVVKLGTIDRWLRWPALVALPGSAFGVLGVFLGGGALARGPQAEVKRDILSCALSACGAVVVLALGCALAGLGSIPGDIPARTIAIGLPVIHADAVWWAAYASLFTLPIVLTTLIAIGAPRGAAVTGHGIVVAPSLAIALVFVAMIARAERGFAELAVLPRDVAHEPLPMAGDASVCDALVGSRLVRLDGRGAHATGLDVSWGAPGDCAAAATAIDKLSPSEDPWLEVEAYTAIERVTCLLDELGRVRGQRFHGASLATARGAREAIPGCGVLFAGTVKNDRSTDLSCRRFELADPRCSPSPDARYGQGERVFEVTVGKSSLVRFTRGGATVYSVDVDIDVLGKTLQKLWKENGDHRDPYDKHFDRALVRWPEGIPFFVAMAAIESFDVVQRPFRVNGKTGDVPAFLVMLASIDYRPTLEPDVPPFDLPPADAPDTEQQRAREAVEAAAQACARGGCTRALRARIAFAQGTVAARQKINPSNHFATARILDPSLVPDVPWITAPNAEISVVDGAGIAPATLDRWIEDLRPEILACSNQGTLWGSRARTSDYKLHVARSGTVAWVAPGKDGKWCIAGVLEGSRMDAIGKANAEPTLRITLDGAKLR